MKLSTLIRNYREDNNLSGRTFAKMCGVSNGYISQLEHEIIKSPTMEKVKKIANCMGYELDDFINMLDDDIVITVKAKPVEEKEDFPLTDKEKSMIGKYRKLNSQEVELVDNLIDQFVKKGELQNV